MPELTNEQLAEIEARAAKATPGPWRQDESDVVAGEAIIAELLCNYNDTLDADFIAHARTDIPLLIAELRRLRAERLTPEELETVLGALETEIQEESLMAGAYRPGSVYKKKHIARTESILALRAKIEAARDGGEG